MHVGAAETLFIGIFAGRHLNQGWPAEEVLRGEIRRREKDWRKGEAKGGGESVSKAR